MLSVRSDPSRGELVAEWKSVSGKDVIIDLTDPIKSAILEGKQRVTIVVSDSLFFPLFFI